ncbi:MAG: hypothetical protein IKT32_02040, partial [Clostridia bacterium]|nr:hypothetical protein [Clostridia bacterium]
WLLFGVKMPTDMATPSGLASNGLAGGDDLPETPDVGGGGSTEDVSDLLAKDTLTIEEAIKIGGTLSHDTTTTKKYYITGTVKDVSNTQYGNMNVQDANGNYIYVYGTYGTDGQTRYDALENKPVAGDTVKLYTVVGNYNGAQLKNAWIVEHNGNSTGNQGGNEGGGNTTPDNPGSGDNSTVTGSVPSESARLATFELGTNASGHVDGNEASSYTETNNGYTLKITNGVKMYPGSADAKGNSCLKLGASKSNGTASFTVPNDVQTVVLLVAQYKSNASSIIINGTSTTINTASDNGAYTAICVDTSTVKTINLESNKRVMINSISFYGEDNGGTNPDQGGNQGGETPDPDQGGDDVVDPPVQNYQTITIAQAVEMGSGMTHDTVTDEKYYIYGIIDNIQDTYYGNMTIKDANGNSIYVYGSFDAEGKNYFGYYEYPPVAGDKVKLLTVVGNYNGAQLKNAWILEYGNDVVMPDDFNNGGNEEHKHEYSSKVTAPTCTASGYTTYTCECGHSYTANEVPANGHDYIEGNCSVCGAEDPNYEGGNQGGETPDPDPDVCTHEGTEWIVTLQPVVGIDGERYKVCEDCGEKIVEKIPALTGGFSGDCNSSLDLGTVGLLLSAVATAVVLKKRK